MKPTTVEGHFASFGWPRSWRAPHALLHFFLRLRRRTLLPLYLLHYIVLPLYLSAAGLLLPVLLDKEVWAIIIFHHHHRTYHDCNNGDQRSAAVGGNTVAALPLLWWRKIQDLRVRHLLRYHGYACWMRRIVPNQILSPMPGACSQAGRQKRQMFSLPNALHSPVNSGRWSVAKRDGELYGNYYLSLSWVWQKYSH